MAIISSITGSTFLHDTKVYFRDLLRDNITDPKNRPAVRGVSGAQFVRTHWPERSTIYPVITVGIELGPSSFMGLQSTNQFHEVTPNIRVWSKSTRQRDEICDEVLTVMAQNRMSGASTDYKLYDMKLLSATDIDEPGKGGVHSKEMIFDVKFSQVF